MNISIANKKVNSYSRFMKNWDNESKKRFDHKTYRID